MEKQTYQPRSQQQIVKVFLIILLTLFLSSFSMATYALLVFNIAPNGQLPTSVPAGGTVIASYVVTNNTASQRSGNCIKYFPPNVALASGGCASNFNLAPRGTPGSSCILNLTVSGPVNGSDPDLHHHLFACFHDSSGPGHCSNSTVCAGTLYPLNVAVGSAVLTSIAITPVSATIAIGGTQQFTAIGTYSNNSTTNLTSSVLWHSSNTAVATISAAGLATAVASGSATITATLNSITSNSATLTPVVVTPHAYMVNDVDSTVSICSISSDGSFSACHTSGSGFNDPIGIAINPAGTYAYIVNLNTNNVSYCTITSNGDFGTCNTTGTEFSFPIGVAINPAGTIAYVTNSGTNTVTYCTIDNDGSFSACTNAGGSGFFEPTGLAINPLDTFAYVPNDSGNNVSFCSINSGGGFGTCSLTGGSIFDSPTVIAINSEGTYAYIANLSINTVYYCVINSDGSFGACNPTGIGFNGPFGIAINPAGTYAYVTNALSNSISYCAINSDGSFGTCNPAGGSGFNGLQGLAVR